MLFLLIIESFFSDWGTINLSIRVVEIPSKQKKNIRISEDEIFVCTQFFNDPMHSQTGNFFLERNFFENCLT